MSANFVCTLHKILIFTLCFYNSVLNTHNIILSLILILLDFVLNLALIKHPIVSFP